MSTITLHEFRFVPADADHIKTGLLGWVSFALNETLRVDGVAVRRTADGRLTLAFPSKTDKHGRKRSLIWPLSEDARLDLESQVFDALLMDTRKQP